jgi:hypothetical protein
MRHDMLFSASDKKSQYGTVKQRFTSTIRTVTIPPSGKVKVNAFWNSPGILFVDFLTEQQIIN